MIRGERIASPWWGQNDASCSYQLRWNYFYILLLYKKMNSVFLGLDKVLNSMNQNQWNVLKKNQMKCFSLSSFLMQSKVHGIC